MATDPLLSPNLPGNTPPPAPATPAAAAPPATPPANPPIAAPIGPASPPAATSPAQAVSPPAPPAPVSPPPPNASATVVAPNSADSALPPAPAPASSGIDWSAAVQKFAQQQQMRATGNLLAAQSVDPDKAAAAAALAPVLGLPAVAMEADSGFWQSQFALRANRAMISTDANLQNWIANDPGNARVASDDVQQLGIFGRAARGFNQAVLSSQANQLEASEGAGIATPMQTDLLQTLKEQLATYQQQNQAAQGQQPAYTGPKSSRQAALGPITARKTSPVPTLGGMAQGAGEFAGQLAETAPEVAAGAATGAALGALGGPGGILGGAMAGGGRGLVIGFMGQSAVDTYGQTYDTLANATDKNGKPVPEMTRQAASLIAGTLSGALAGVGGAEAAPFIRDVAAEAATRPALSAAIQRFALGTVKAGVTGALVNGGMGLVQNLAPQIAEAVTSPDFQTVFNDPAQRAALVNQTVDQMQNGAMLFSALHVPMAGVSLVMDAARAEAASQALQKWQAMQTGAAGSKLRGRAPNAFAALMKTYTGDGSIGIPGDKMAELYQTIGSHPGATDDPFRFVPDMQAQLERARLTGGDVIVPTAEFTARLAGTPIEQALRPDIRFNPDGMTMREAMEFHAANPGEFEPADLSDLTDEDAGDVKPRAQDEAAVRADVAGQLRQAGYTPDQAQQNAALVQAFFGTLASRLNLSPLDLYRAENLQIRREAEHTAGPANYTGVDEVIDALRRGDKQPSDKELYGPSLLEFLRKAGGLKDEGGDLKAMGAKGKLINPNGMALDEAAQRAFQPGAFDKAGDGYFPDNTEENPPDANDLLEAIRDELNGNKRYRTASTQAIERQQFRQAQRDLDQFLNERGIDIKTATNAEIKAAWQRSAENAAELAQESATGAVRGSITMAEGAHIIRLFRESNASTFPHEAMHLFTDVMQRAAEREDAPQQLRDDLAAMRKFAGLKDGETFDAMTPEGIAAHEKLATAFETYLMEGKAPSNALRQAFQKFAAWLARVYRGLLNSGTPINDSIRGVMDRMLATDDAIEEARQGLGMRNPLFFDAESAGMTGAEFAIYTNKIAAAKTDMYDRVLRRAMRTEELRRTQEWRDAAEHARPEIEAQVKARPVLQAWKFLAAGKDLLGLSDEVEGGKLSTSAVRDILAGSYPRFPRGLTAEDGMHPDMIAPAFGYASGEQMLRDLVNENVGRQDASTALGRDLSFDAYVRRLIDQALDRHLEAKFGDPLQDGTIEEVAMKAAHDAAQLDVIATEMRQLAKLNGARMPVSVRQVQEWVRSSFADTAMNKATRVAMYRRAEAKAANDAQRALLAKKPIEAFQAKQRQMIAHLSAAEAGRLQGVWQRTTAQWRAIAKQPTRPGTNQAYLDQVHRILTTIGMTVRRDAGELARGLEGKSLEDFVRRNLDMGNDIAVPNFLLNPRAPMLYGDLTADQFEAARDAVASLMHVGRAVGSVRLEDKVYELRDIADLIADEAAELPSTARQRPIGTPGTVEGWMRSMASNLRQGDAFLRKIEDLFRILGGPETGTLLKVVFDPLKIGQHKNNDFRVEAAGMFRDLMARLPDKWGKQDFKRQYSINELPNRITGKPEVMTHDGLLATALNVGNASNLMKLEKGMGWPEGSVMPVLQRILSKEDWDFVQGVWNIFEHYRPAVDELQRRMTGVGIKFVDAVPIETRFGTYRGGYFPVDYDPAEAKTPDIGEQQLSPFPDGYYRATTPQGHTKGRTGYYAPLNLNMDVIPLKLGQMLHDLSYRGPVMEAWKILNHPVVAGTIKDKLGKEYLDILNPWLRDVAGSANINDKQLAWFNKIMKYSRINAGATYIGLNPFTVILHGTTAYLHSLGETGAKEGIRASRDLFDGTYNAKRNWDFVMQNSGEMRHREGMMDEDMRGGLKALMGLEGGIKTKLQKAQAFGYYFIGKADLYSAAVVWLGKYRALMRDGVDHDEAVMEADRAVRMSHGSAAMLDKAALYRSNEVIKSVGTFGQFYNHMYNRVRDISYTAQRGLRARSRGDNAGARRDFADVLSKSFLYLFLPSMLATVVRGALEGQKDQNQSWLDYAAESLLGETTAMIPGLNAIASLVMGHGSQLNFTPFSGEVTTAFQAFEDARHGIEGAPVSGRWLEHAAQTVGYLTGLPGGGTLGKAAQYLWDIEDGEIDPQSLQDFMAGVLRGPAKGQ